MHLHTLQKAYIITDVLAFITLFSCMTVRVWLFKPLNNGLALRNLQANVCNLTEATTSSRAHFIVSNRTHITWVFNAGLNFSKSRLQNPSTVVNATRVLFPWGKIHLWSFGSDNNSSMLSCWSNFYQQFVLSSYNMTDRFVLTVTVTRTHIEYW